MTNGNSMESLAQKFFGPDWAEDPQLQGFVEAASQAQAASGATADESPSSLGELSAERLLRLVMDSIPASVFWKDLDSCFIGGNKQFANDIGVKHATDAVGLDDFEYSEKDMADEYRAIDRSVMENDQPVRNLREPQLRDGELAWIETNKIPLHGPDGKVVGLLGTYADVTEHVVYQEKLSAANAELEQVSGFKDQFLASVSHELRTPLNPILALSELLRTGNYGPLNERQQGALTHVIDSAKQLHSLIEDMLEISHFELGKEVDLVLSPTSLQHLFEKMIEGIESAADAKQISIEICCDEYEVDRHFYIDTRRIERALAILLDNAIKFTDPGGEVRLSARVDPDNGTIRLSVADNGIGIAEENRESIFEAFGQIDRELTRAYNGAGIGLAIAKRVAEQHGGSIELASELGLGSRFTIVLPAHTRVADLESIA